MAATREHWLRFLAAHADGASGSGIHAWLDAVAAACAVFPGRQGLPRSLGSVLGAAVARFLPRRSFTRNDVFLQSCEGRQYFRGMYVNPDACALQIIHYSRRTECMEEFDLRDSGLCATRVKISRVERVLTSPAHANEDVTARLVHRGTLPPPAPCAYALASDVYVLAFDYIVVCYLAVTFEEVFRFGLIRHDINAKAICHVPRGRTNLLAVAEGWREDVVMARVSLYNLDTGVHVQSFGETTRTSFCAIAHIAPSNELAVADFRGVTIYSLDDAGVATASVSVKGVAALAALGDRLYVAVMDGAVRWTPDDTYHVDVYS
jgi:hypothetical protein